MAYEIQAEPDTSESYYFSLAQMMGGMMAAGATFQRFETVIGPDGQEYTKIVEYTTNP